MNKRIKIAYAYRGLTYLPLFLANSEESFSSRFELVYTDGDEKAIDLLLNKNNGCEMAICDPFAKDNLLEESKTHLGSVDSIKLIGCLIDKSPIWIYREDTSLAPNKIISTDELKNYNIHAIKGYSHPNTGWIFCKELKKKLDTNVNNIHLITVNFNPDIEDKVSQGEILLTSNILKIAITDFVKGNHFSSTIYSYGRSKDPKENLKDLFFTGILAKQDKYTAQFFDYALFCNELKKWIKALYEDDIEDIVNDKFEYFKEHVKNYPAIKNLNDEQKKEILRNIINKIRVEQIYPRDLRGNVEKFNKMMQKRKEYNPNLKLIKYYKFVDYYILNRTKGTKVIFESIFFFLEKVNSKFIRPLVNSKINSKKFIILNCIQLIPAIGNVILSAYIHEPKLSSLFQVLSVIGIGTSLLIDFVVIMSKKKNNSHEDLDDNGIKLFDGLLALNLAFVYAVLIGILIEVYK